MVTNETIVNAALPVGWHSEELSFAQTLVTMPSGEGGPGGYVTIDWARRGFRAGCSPSGRMVGSEKYAGRGWKEKLASDAVAWLQGVCAERPSADKDGAR